MNYFTALQRFWKVLPGSRLDPASSGLMLAFLHLWNEAGRPDTMAIPNRDFTEGLGFPRTTFFRLRDNLTEAGFLVVDSGRTRAQSPVYQLGPNMGLNSPSDKSHIGTQTGQDKSQDGTKNDQDKSQLKSQDKSHFGTAIYREEEKEYKEDPKPLNASAPQTQAPADGPSQDVFLSAASLLNPPMSREDATALWNHYTVRDWQDGMKRSLLRHWRMWQGLPGTREFANKLAMEARNYQRSSSSQDRDRKSNTARQPPQDVLDAAWIAYGGDLPAPAWPSLKANAATLNALANAHPPLRQLLSTP